MTGAMMYSLAIAAGAGAFGRDRLFGDALEDVGFARVANLAVAAACAHVLAAVCVVLPLAPWTVRNWRTFHVIQPLAPRYARNLGELVPLGFQRWYRTWAIDFASTEEVYWNYNSAPIEIGDLPGRAFDSNDQYAQTAAILTDYNRGTTQPGRWTRVLKLWQGSASTTTPSVTTSLCPSARLLNMLFRLRRLLEVALEWWRWREYPGQLFIATGFAALNLGYFVLGGVGLWRWRRSGWGRIRALAAAMVGFVGSAVSSAADS